MPDKHFQKDLRAEYDQELMDVDQRRKLAGRLHQAMKKAGVWPADRGFLTLDAAQA